MKALRKLRQHQLHRENNKNKEGTLVSSRKSCMNNMDRGDWTMIFLLLCMKAPDCRKVEEIHKATNARLILSQ